MPPPERFTDVVPLTWQDVTTFEIDPGTKAVTLTRAGESWARDQGAKIGTGTYQLTLDDSGEVTFAGLLVAAPEEEKKDTGAGLKPNWFRGVAPAGETMRGPMWTGESYSIGDIDVSGMSARVRAALDAFNAGYKAHEFEVIVGTGDRAGYVSWQAKGAGTPADETWTVYQADDGSIFMYDKEVGPSSRFTIAQASTITPTGPNVDQIGKGIKNSDGSVTKFYSVTDSQGRTSMQSVKEWDTITKDSAIPLETGGRLIPTGGGRYTYEPPPEAPFTTSPDDVVKVAGGQLVKTSKNQYQFVRDTYEPGVVEDPLAPGRKFTQSPSGIWTELAPRYDPAVTDVEGMKLLQQRSGQIGQLTPPNLDQIITQALVDGEYDKAFAFQDFQQRPTAQEAFETALAFARSPADQRIISAIARGITPVQPPPEGTIQRVGPQPDFLVQAYQDFQRRTQAGRAPTEEEATSLSARAAAGQTPLSDTLQIQNETLQTRLEALTRDQDRKDEKHALEMQGMRQSQDEQAQIFKTKNNIAMGLNADGTPKSSSSTASGNGLFGGTEVTRDSGPIGDSGTVASSQENMSLVWGQLNDAQKAFFTDHFTRNKGRVPVGAEALTDFYMPDITQFEERVKYHLSGIPVGDPAGPPVASGLGNRTVAGIFYNPAVDPTPTPAVDPTPTPAVDPEPTGAAVSGTERERREQRETERERIEFNLDPGIVGGPQLGRTGTSSTQLAGYEPGTSFADIARALGQPVIPERTVAPDVQKSLDIDAARAERSDLASALAGARSGAGARVNWENDPNVIAAQSAYDLASENLTTIRNRAGGGTVRPGEITVVGEQGPEIAMMPPGTHILPLGKATKKDIRAAQSTGRAYQQGGIVFDELEPGLQQLWRGRPITPPRGYLFQQGGLPLPSPQALQNLTPGTRESFMGMAGDIGIFPAEFRQELQTATPRGTRLPTSRMLPLGRRGVR